MSSSKFDLFPVPSLTPSSISPARLPGVSPESTAALREALQENHEKWHIFFNDRGFHNHTSHHLLASWSLGASAPILKATYNAGASYQRPAFKSPEEIDTNNFNDHLGDENYYNSYLQFFKKELEAKGFSATLEEHIFAKKANFIAGSDKPQPEMLSRFLGGLLHPLIHTGYGAEFGLPGMLVEGLAQTAVHKADSQHLLPALFFDGESATNGLINRLASALVLNNQEPRTSSATQPKNVHALDILARVMKDTKLDVKNAAFDRSRPGGSYVHVEEHFGEDIRKYVEQWTLDTSVPGEVEKKIEELVWTNSVIYAVPGWKKGERFLADFVFMHFVTSSTFLSSLIPYLKPKSQELLLRSYFTLCLAFFVAQGAPKLSIAAFFTETDSYPSPPKSSLPKPHEDALTGGSADAALPNAWSSILQNCIVYPDEHLPKLQRSLAHYSSIYGARQAGEPDFSATELEGADKIDGSLFIRAAGLTADRLGRVQDGMKKEEFWDRISAAV
ncbi:hypothetical protein HGRIS_010967 [Hohenbuehelia grisea]|uniref:Uncharacterized protein n=1 Tax=Hohenbuehelia grisea TaxID=104357 RepID=A0ABR3IZ65_9AGAR